MNPCRFHNLHFLHCRCLLALPLLSSDHGRADDPMENDEVLEEVLRYASKEEDKFVNGVFSGKQGQYNAVRNANGFEIITHSGLGIENKD